MPTFVTLSLFNVQVFHVQVPTRQSSVTRELRARGREKGRKGPGVVVYLSLVPKIEVCF